MFHNYRIIIVTPAGRERYLEILLPYILRNREVIDEYHLWINTTNKSDIKYMNDLAKRFPNFIKLISLNIEPSGNKTIRFFFQNCTQKDTIYIRIDDDICFIEKNAIKELLNFRIFHPNYFIVYANIINNSICSYINQKKGNIGFSKGNLTYNSFCNTGWKSGEFASFIHSKFIEDNSKGLLNNYQYSYWILSDFERVSVNFITWFGKDFADFNGIIDGEDEEQWLSVDKPKNINRYNCICGSAIVSHFSYYTQREYLESKTNILQKYKLFSEEVLSSLFIQEKSVGDLEAVAKNITIIFDEEKHIFKENYMDNTWKITSEDLIHVVSDKMNKITEKPAQNLLNQLSLPAIQDIIISESKPFWSVMIPTYNCANYLIETLKSVLAQDPGCEQMQIEVVDDCSTKDDPEAIVKEIGQGRVSFFRKPQNDGATANFNTCIERAKGEWIHILHGDDTVLPGFYSRLRTGIEKEPSVGAAFSRYIHIDENGNWRQLSWLERETPGTLLDFWQPLAVVNRVMTPCIVVKQSVYEELGGFHSELIHAADWEMWKRIAVHYPIWFEPQPLACYREHSSSDTSRLIRSGENLVDIHKSIDISELYLPNTFATELSNQSREFYATKAFDTARRLLSTGDVYAAFNQIREALKCYDSPRIMGSFASLLTDSEALLRLAASLFISTDTNKIFTFNSEENQPDIKVELELRDINLIIFPNWEFQDEFLYEDLTSIIRSIVTSPDKDRISLLIDNSRISDEDANFIISDVIFDLFQQADLDLAGEPVIHLVSVSSLTERQWKVILEQIHARIILRNENEKEIFKIGADRIFSLQPEELKTRLETYSTPSLDSILLQIQSLPRNWHTGGALPVNVLQTIAKHVKFQQIFYSVETGSGASTLLLSHISQEHKVFSYDCGSNGLTIVQSSPLLNRTNVEFIEGPTQQTLTRYKFDKKIQLALIDGPHAYPFPELEYYFIYPHLEENSLLILDDIHIPNIYNMFAFLREDEMFKLIDVVDKTAFFKRTEKPVFNQFEDNWLTQNFNKNRFPISW